MLVDARRSATKTHPPSSQLSDFDTVRAWQIALHTADLNRSTEVVGYKIGLVAPRAQEAIGHNEPVFGRIFSDGLYRNGAGVSLGTLISPQIEPECALVLGTRLEGDITAEQARAAVDRIVPAFEIADSRYGNPPECVADLIADNAGGTGAVLTLADGLPASDVDLSAVGLTVYIDNHPHASCLGAPGQPYELLAWLASSLSSKGLAIEKGQFVITGSWTQPIDVAGPMHVRADFSGLGMVEVDLRS